mgnify:FL=1
MAFLSSVINSSGFTPVYSPSASSSIQTNNVPHNITQFVVQEVAPIFSSPKLYVNELLDNGHKFCFRKQGRNSLVVKQYLLESCDHFKITSHSQRLIITTLNRYRIFELTLIWKGVNKIFQLFMKKH